MIAMRLFEMPTITGRMARVLVLDGKHDYEQGPEPSLMGYFDEDCGEVFIIQVGRPVGVDGRSAIASSKLVSDRSRAIIQWARDTATYASIIAEFNAAGLWEIQILVRA